MPKAYDPRDAFYRKAKQQNLRARSAFKIDEIQQRLKLVRSGDAVVDLGAAPGGFLQVLAQTVGPRGRIVGVDLVTIADRAAGGRGGDDRLRRDGSGARRAHPQSAGPSER